MKAYCVLLVLLIAFETIKTETCDPWTNEGCSGTKSECVVNMVGHPECKEPQTPTPDYDCNPQTNEGCSDGEVCTPMPYGWATCQVQTKNKKKLLAKN